MGRLNEIDSLTHPVLSQLDDSGTLPSRIDAFAGLLHPDSVISAADRLEAQTQGRRRVINGDKIPVFKEQTHHADPVGISRPLVSPSIVKIVPVIEEKVVAAAPPAPAPATEAQLLPSIDAPYISDNDLDKLMRWHKYRHAFYPMATSETQVAIPQNPTGWKDTGLMWDVIDAHRVAHGQSSISEFSLQRGYTKKVSLADAKPISLQAYFAEKAKEEDEAAPEPEPDTRPALTDAYLRQLLLWHREKIGGRWPGEKTQTPVWTRSESGKWTVGADTWETITDALRTGTRGVETKAESIAAFIATQRPPLTADYLKQLLAWSKEKDGHYATSTNARPAFTKNTDGGWEQSLYNWREIEAYVYNHNEAFDAPSLTKFKDKHGLTDGIRDNSGLGWISPQAQSFAVAAAFAEKPHIPRITLLEPVSAANLQELVNWHSEKEGVEPDSEGTTPVWIKQEDESWAQAETSWPQLMAPLLAEVAALEAEVQTMQRRNLSVSEGFGHYMH